jgi:hypothetical protein
VAQRKGGVGWRKPPKPEEIVAKLRQVEVLVGQDKPVADAVRRVVAWTPVASGTGLA